MIKELIRFPKVLFCRSTFGTDPVGELVGISFDGWEFHRAVLCGALSSREESASTSFEELALLGLREETVVADPNEAFGQDVEEESAKEFCCR